MVAIKLDKFGGMIPTIDAKLLPVTAAFEMRNAWVLDGTLAGLRVPRLIHTLVNPQARSVFRIPKIFPDAVHLQDSYWLEFEVADTSIVRSPNTDAEDPAYLWADGLNPPGYTTESRIVAPSASLILGIPAPTVAPTVVPAGGVSGVTEARAYVYTWVSAYGEEGPPSPPSIVTTGKIDDTWAIGVTAAGAGVTANRNITLTRIYRTITSDQGVAEYFFVTELALATLTYNDTQLSTVVELNEQLLSTLWTGPPVDLAGVVTMPNGMIAGWRENELWFCEPYRPHAWPVSYQISVDYPIVGLGVYGQTLLVGTSGIPYTCTGVHPKSMALARLPISDPCVSRGSIVSAAAGVYYASPSGLVLVASGSAKLITETLLGKEHWQSLLSIKNMNAAMLGNSYYCFSGVTDGVFEDTAFEASAFETEDFGGTRNGATINLGDVRIAFGQLVETDPTYNVLTDVWCNEVLVIRSGGVYHVDLTNNAVQGQYFWLSKLFQMSEPTNLSVVKVFYKSPRDVASPSTVMKTYANGVLVQTKTLPASGEMFRLPHGFSADTYRFELSGNYIIENVQIASTPKELSGV